MQGRNTLVNTTGQRKVKACESSGEVVIPAARNGKDSWEVYHLTWIIKEKDIQKTSRHKYDHNSYYLMSTYCELSTVQCALQSTGPILTKNPVKQSILQTSVWVKEAISQIRQLTQDYPAI